MVVRSAIYLTERISLGVWRSSQREWQHRVREKGYPQSLYFHDSHLAVRPGGDEVPSAGVRGHRADGPAVAEHADERLALMGGRMGAGGQEEKGALHLCCVALCLIVCPRAKNSARGPLYPSQRNVRGKRRCVPVARVYSLPYGGAHARTMVGLHIVTVPLRWPAQTTLFQGLCVRTSHLRRGL